MPFIISKIAGFLVTPFSWILIGTMVTACLFLLKKRAAYYTFWTTAALTVLLTNPLLAHIAMHTWEQPQLKHTSVKSAQQYEYAIVLSGMVAWNKNQELMNFGHSADRILAAVKLYHQNKIEKILVTGGSASIFEKNTPESEVLKKFLEHMNIPDHAIITESNSRNTFDHAVYLKAMLQDGKLNDNSMLLITSAYHLKRAKACFDKQEIEVTPYAVDFYAPDFNVSIYTLMVPSQDALLIWDLLWHEWMGIFFYKMAGYIA